jgi:excisionase family DNA binding protein
MVESCVAKKLRLSAAAEYVGVHPITLRKYADEGRVAVSWVGKERRFLTADLDAYLGVDSLAVRPRSEGLYIRVSSTSGQETSLAAQETELRLTSTGAVFAVYRDTGSGLSEKRAGLTRLLRAAAAGDITVVRVTHEDRLARFGVSWFSALLERDGVTVEVLHDKGSAGGMDELLADFMSLIATFAGRMYGIRSREAKRRLLAAASARIPAGEE